MNNVDCIGTFLSMENGIFISVFNFENSYEVFDNRDTFEQIHIFAKFTNLNINMIELHVFVEIEEFKIHLKNYINDEINYLMINNKIDRMLI